MKAVRWHARGRVVVDEVPEPTIRYDEDVVLSIEACGICGTDLEEARHGPKAIPVDRPNPTTGRIAPLTLGHEILGVVMDAGPRAGVTPGHRVAVWPQIPCGRCPACRGAAGHRCPFMGVLGLSEDGGFAESVVVSGRSIVPIDRSVAMERAVLAEPYAVAIHAFGHRPPERESVAIFGVGSVGAALVEVAVQLGANRVVAVSRQARNREAAIRAGATEAVEPQDLARESVTIAVDASGADDALELMARVLRYGGTGIVVGIRSKIVPAPIWEVFARELRFVGSNGIRLGEFAAAVDMIQTGRLAQAARPVHSVPLTEVPSVLLKAEDTTIKYVAVPR